MHLHVLHLWVLLATNVPQQVRRWRCGKSVKRVFTTIASLENLTPVILITANGVWYAVLRQHCSVLRLTLLAASELSPDTLPSAPLKYLVHLVGLRSLHLELRGAKLPILVHHNQLRLLALTHLIVEVVVLLKRRVLDHTLDGLLRVYEVLFLRCLHLWLLLLLLLRHVVAMHLQLLLELVLRKLHHLQLHPALLVLLAVLVVTLQGELLAGHGQWDDLSAAVARIHLLLNRHLLLHLLLPHKLILLLPDRLIQLLLLFGVHGKLLRSHVVHRLLHLLLLLLL